MANYKIAILVGSLRKDSINRKIAKSICAMRDDNLDCSMVEIGDLPLYNQDFDKLSEQPEQYVRFRDQIRQADGVLFVTPEYNRSVPGVLKNAIDVGSRPYGQSVFDGKPGAVVSVTPGGLGAFGANHHLRQSLVFLNVPTLQSEAYISGAGALFDDQGRLVNEDTRGFLTKYASDFARWVELVAAARTPELV